jgi:hypothetical protein
MRMLQPLCWLITTRPLRGSGVVLAHAASTTIAVTQHKHVTMI